VDHEAVFWAIVAISITAAVALGLALALLTAPGGEDEPRAA
jgi:anti-sigma-K factor RskA